MSVKLSSRLDHAEGMIAAGDWIAGVETYRAIVEQEWRASAGVVEPVVFSITNRCGDLAVLAGLPALALSAYGRVAAGAPREMRVAAMAKMVDLTSTTSHPSAAGEFRELEMTIWGEQSETPRPGESLKNYDLQIRTKGLVCLAIGRFYNSRRALAASGDWLEKGLQVLPANDQYRLDSIPLRLAIVRHWLTIGNLSEANAELRKVETDSTRVAGGEIYQMWLADAAIDITISRGLFAEAMRRLDDVEAIARQKGLWEFVSRSLLHRAELLNLLNELTPAKACLDEAEVLIRKAASSDLTFEYERIRRLWVLRRGLVHYLEASASVTAMQGDSAEIALPQDDELSMDPSESTVLTGDTLRDYLVRESQVLQTLDRAARSGKKGTIWEKRALRALTDLEEDFASLPSRLIRARLSLTTGVVRQAINGDGACALRQARSLFLEIGAKHGLWFANDHLIASAPQQHQKLIEENAVLLGEMAAGLTPDESNFFFLNKYQADEWWMKERIDQILRCRAEMTANRPLPEWWSALSARLDFWQELDRFVWDLDQVKLDRRTRSTPRKRRSPWVELIAGLFLRTPRLLTVGYIVLPDVTFVYWRAWGKLDCRALPFGRATVRDLMSGLHSSVTEPDEFRQQAGRVCQRLGLTEILSSLPRRMNQIVIVTDDMTALPFCALRWRPPGDQHQYIVERFAVSISELSYEPPRAASERQGAISAYYNGGLDQDAVLTQAQPSAQAASRWFASHWGGENLVTPDLEDFRQALPRAAAFHYFGHGDFSSHTGGTALGFAGAGGKQTFSIADLEGIDFTGMEQASIFACRGGESISTRGRWSAGMPQLLRRRGVRSVIASLWQANEDVAAEVSAAFLKDARTLGRAQALRRFQIAQIAGGPTRSGPFDWAPFQIYGDDARLRRPGKRFQWLRTRLR